MGVVCYWLVFDWILVWVTKDNNPIRLLTAPKDLSYETCAGKFLEASQVSP